MSPDVTLDWEEEMATSHPHDCVSLPSNHPLYVLYTSGTTGTPKVVRFLLETGQQSSLIITVNTLESETAAPQAGENICRQFEPQAPKNIMSSAS